VDLAGSRPGPAAADPFPPQVKPGCEREDDQQHRDRGRFLPRQCAQCRPQRLFIEGAQHLPTEIDPLVGANGLVTISSGVTLTARAFRADLQPSTVTVATFTLQAGKPVFSPHHGPITNGTSLLINTATPGASIYYTLDGTDPTPASLLYTAPLTVDTASVVSARAFRTGFADSEINRVYFSGTVILTNVRFASGFLNFNWASETGRRYQVQISSDLVNWSDLGEPQAGIDRLLGASVQTSGGSRFVRVRIY